VDVVEDVDELLGLVVVGVVPEGAGLEPDEVVVVPVLGVDTAEAPVPVAVVFKQLVLVPA